MLYELADYIGLPWKRVGLRLGLHSAALEQIQMENSYSWDRVCCMLLRWFRSHTGDGESKAITLKKALINSGFRIENPQILQEQVGTQKIAIAA